MEQKEYLTVKEAADFLRISVGYLYKLMMWKKVPYYKPTGNRCYFKRAELGAWMEAARSCTEYELQAQAISHTLNTNY